MAEKVDPKDYKKHGKGSKYKDKVSNDVVVAMIEGGIANSANDWMRTSELAVERRKATYEYVGLAEGHLRPQGVSSIVDTSTTEVVEAYTAILCDLFLNNGKLARFVPTDDAPISHKNARDAAAMVNYAIFKQNDGWSILQSWIKAALLWKNAVVHWDHIEDWEYVFEEYERISQIKLDELLADENVEIVGDLEFENELGQADPLGGQQPDAELVYINVRLKRKIDKSRVRLYHVPPENFRISRDATCIEDAAFVGLQVVMSRSDIRKYWPDAVENITEEDWDRISSEDYAGFHTTYNYERAARRDVLGLTRLSDLNLMDFGELEANRDVIVTDSWMRVDRDGDGIAELKHFVTAGDIILFEEDCEMIPVASLSPIDIPHEFHGLSIADMTRSSTLASTAILRGFVENTYLTNYSPKLADPNVVDFSALQNMRPKQIIATNGNPAAAVQTLPPETISTGTVPLMEHLQLMKEQATGMSKAAQGLQDELFVSGNSEAKLAQVQSASQKRIYHIARRFAETGLKRLVKGVYKTAKHCQRYHQSFSYAGQFHDVDVDQLPREMDVEIFLDLGENSNSNKLAKLQQVGQAVLPALNQAGQGMVVRPEAPAVLATQILESMGLDSNEYLEDYTTDEFKQKAMKALEEQSAEAERVRELEQRKQEADAALAEANVTYTAAQSKNVMDDNAKQLAVAIDTHYQQWAELAIKAVKEGAELPPHPEIQQIIGAASQLIKGQG